MLLDVFFSFCSVLCVWINIIIVIIIVVLLFYVIDGVSVANRLYIEFTELWIVNSFKLLWPQSLRTSHSLRHVVSVLSTSDNMPLYCTSVFRIERGEFVCKGRGKPNQMRSLNVSCFLMCRSTRTSMHRPAWTRSIFCASSRKPWNSPSKISSVRTRTDRTRPCQR